MFKKKAGKGQASLEYLMLASFVMGILIVLVVFFQSYSQETQDQVRMTQLHQLAKKLADSAEEVYYLGAPSKVTIKARLPSNIKSVSIGNKEIFFVLSTYQGDNEIVYVSKINITGTLPKNEGLYDIIIESKGSYVQIHT